MDFEDCSVPGIVIHVIHPCNHCHHESHDSEKLPCAVHCSHILPSPFPPTPTTDVFSISQGSILSLPTGQAESTGELLPLGAALNQ